MNKKLSLSNINRQIVTSKRKSLGQGMTEYIIIVALIAIAAIAVFRLFGDTARNQVAGMALELSGQSGTTAQGAAEAAATESAEAGNVSRNLSNYTDNN